MLKVSDGSPLKGNERLTLCNLNLRVFCATLLSLGCVHAQEFNQWFALYRDTATTEHLKTAASRQQKEDILKKVHLVTVHPAVLYGPTQLSPHFSGGLKPEISEPVLCLCSSSLMWWKARSMSHLLWSGQKLDHGVALCMILCTGLSSWCAAPSNFHVVCCAMQKA